MNIKGLSGVILNPSATKTDIDNVEIELQSNLPDSYKELLLTSNGVTTDNGIIIYGTKDLIERNETWETKDYAPGYIAIGDDSGGNVILMRTNVEEVLIVDSGAMTPEHASLLSTSLSEWMKSGFKINSEIKLNIDWSENCKVVIVEIRDGGFKDLIRIKGKLGLTIPTSELLRKSKNLPFVLTEDIPHGKVKKTIDGLGEINLKIELQ